MTDKKQIQLFIATPMYGGLCNGSYTVGLLTAVGIFANNGIAIQYAHMMNESLITRARNALAKDFLASGSTHLMFIDADIGFNPQDIVRMVNADKEIICGIYPKKEINWLEVTKAVNAGVPPQELHKHTGAFVVNLVGGATSAEGDMYTPLEIANGGTGFMLIKREVFEVLIGRVPTYTNDMFAAIDDQTKKEEINEFFTTSIDKESGNRLLSEDYHFCKIAREAGFKVWAAPWAQLTHTGTYIFSGALPSA